MRTARIGRLPGIAAGPSVAIAVAVVMGACTVPEAGPTRGAATGKSEDDLGVHEPDFLVSVCVGEACPTVDGKTYEAFDLLPPGFVDTALAKGQRSTNTVRVWTHTSTAGTRISPGIYARAAAAGPVILIIIPWALALGAVGGLGWYFLKDDPELPGDSLATITLNSDDALDLARAKSAAGDYLGTLKQHGDGDWSWIDATVESFLNAQSTNGGQARVSFVETAHGYGAGCIHADLDLGPTQLSDRDIVALLGALAARAQSVPPQPPVGRWETARELVERIRQLNAHLKEFDIAMSTDIPERFYHWTSPAKLRRWAEGIKNGRLPVNPLRGEGSLGRGNFLTTRIPALEKHFGLSTWRHPILGLGTWTKSASKPWLYGHGLLQKKAPKDVDKIRLALLCAVAADTIPVTVRIETGTEQQLIGNKIQLPEDLLKELLANVDILELMLPGPYADTHWKDFVVINPDALRVTVDPDTILGAIKSATDELDRLGSLRNVDDSLLHSRDTDFWNDATYKGTIKRLLRSFRQYFPKLVREIDPGLVNN